jgi:hypothetical protein
MTELRWFVDKTTGSWVLQFRTPSTDWGPVPVVYKEVDDEQG